MPYNLLSLVPASDGKSLRILADGQPTDATKRESVLQSFNKDSAAVKAVKLRQRVPTRLPFMRFPWSVVFFHFSS